MPDITRVVNLRKEPYDVYIGRPGHGQNGPFGNPIRPGAVCPACGSTHNTTGTIPCFERYFLRRVSVEPAFRDQALTLKGKRLGCFCAPTPCHGDVIVAWLEGQTGAKNQPDHQLDLFSRQR